MTFPTTFANLAAGNQPAALLDAMFAVLGAAAPIPCTATGTNAITLTPNTNQYVPASYANYQPVTFTPAASLSGAATIRIGALAFVKLFMPTGIQANSGDISSGALVVAVFNSALDTGAGGFMVVNASTPSVIQPVLGTFRNLQITNGGTPDTQIAVTADEIMLENNSGGTLKVSTVSVTIATGSTGANGLDAGSMAAATFYSVWVINNGSTTAGLISTSATAPTMPSGYTYKARVGWVRTGAASTNLHRITQKGRRAQYVVTAASQTLLLPLMASGIAGVVGTTGATTWVAVAVGAFIPSTASEALVVIVPNYNNAGASSLVLAPNSGYSGLNTTNPPPFFIFNSAASFQTASLLLESTNLQWASTAAGGALQCLGWIDNL